jgi:hypothetical protein
MTTDIYVLDLDEELLSHLPDPESWLELKAEGFKVEFIEDDFIREVYEWQNRHAREYGAPATATVLADQFDVGFDDPQTTVGDMLDRMRERYMNNQGRDALKRIGTTFKKDPLVIPDMLAREGRKLQTLLNRRGEMFGTGDVDRALHQYEMKAAKGPGSSLGFPEVDAHHYGQQGLTFVIAPPKSFKSWNIIEVAFANVMKGKHVRISSLELPAEETDMRLRCRAANIPWWHYVRRCMTSEELRRIKEAEEILKEVGMYTISKPPEHERTMDHLIGNARDQGAHLVCVDQLQYVEFDGKSLGAWNDTGKYFGAVNRARDLSDEGDIYIAHQFNREARFADAMPPIEMTKGSSAIEEGATLALGMWANKDMRRSNIVELGTLISRNHGYASWNVQVELSKGCDFKIIGRADEE